MRAEQNSDPLKRIGIYVRVSNIDTQTGDDKASLDEQLRDCKALLERVPGAILVGEYADAERYKVGRRQVDPAGWRVDRPAWLRLFADVRAGRLNTIVAWRIDRLARGLKATAVLDDLLDETGVEVMVVHGGFDKAKLGFDAAISRHELIVIKERTDMGRRGRVRRGLRASDKVPFGYEVLKDAAGRTTGYALKETHVEPLRELARLFVEGRSYSVIADRLGVDPDSGDRWVMQKIYRIVHNEFYHGRLVYAPGGAEGQGAYELPWDEATRRAVQDELRRRKRLNFAPRSERALFNGLLFCDYCQGPMYATNVSEARQYRCGRRQRFRDHRSNDAAGSDHPANQISERRALQQITDLIRHLTPDVIEETVKGFAPIVGDERRAEWLRDQIVQLAAQVEQLEQSLEVKLPEAARLAIAAEYDRARLQLGQRRTDLAQSESNLNPTLDNVRLAMLELARNPDAVLTLPPDVARAKLRAAFPAIYVRHGALLFSKTKN